MLGGGVSHHLQLTTGLVVNSFIIINLVALWCSGSMLASHARGPGFNPRAG